MFYSTQLSNSPGDLLNLILQSLQRAEVTAAGRRFVDPERTGDLGVIQLFEMAQREDLAIDRVHAVQDFLHSEPRLRLDSRL